jgi:hypothetical protein
MRSEKKFKIYQSSDAGNKKFNNCFCKNVIIMGLERIPQMNCGNYSRLSQSGCT